MLETKNVVKSGTIWAILFTAGVAIWPNVTDLFYGKKLTQQQTIEIGLVVFGSGVAIAKRIEAKQKLTIIGERPDKSDKNN